MNNKTKRIVLIIFLIVILSICFILGCRHFNKNEYMLSKIDTEKNNAIELQNYNQEIKPEDIIMNIGGEAEYLINLSDKNVRYDNCDAIIIGTVKTIDGATNYNEKKDEFTMIQTYGTIKVEKVLKGSIDSEIIPFIRPGGVINYYEYEKGLFEAEKLKIRETLPIVSKLNTDSEKKSKYVKYKSTDDIEIEQNKTYLMYLIYDEDQGKYGIAFEQYGLMEIDTNTLNSENITVKNNVNNEWQKLEI